VASDQDTSMFKSTGATIQQVRGLAIFLLLIASPFLPFFYVQHFHFRALPIIGLKWLSLSFVVSLLLVAGGVYTFLRYRVRPVSLSLKWAHFNMAATAFNAGVAALLNDASGTQCGTSMCQPHTLFWITLAWISGCLAAEAYMINLIEFLKRHEKWV
jgi:hypothetical protein